MKLALSIRESRTNLEHCCSASVLDPLSECRFPAKHRYLRSPISLSGSIWPF